MAIRSSSNCSNFESCQSYYLDGAISTGKTLGEGCFGFVLEVKFKHILCAAKQIHDVLLNPSQVGVQCVIEKYQTECQLMASLRHPNITQFLGLCFVEGSQLPLLVMEQLEMSVDDLLKNTSSIPLPVKLSILTDTCCGLVYLHGMKTPIIHRDLTARNVLLTSSLSAKIADLGNSRMVSLSSGHLAQTLSRNPGTAVYMAPEALNDSHRYGPSLDVFSFGHLSLYTLTQVFPGELLPPKYPDPSNPSHLVARSEVERRSIYLDKLNESLSISQPRLCQLVPDCLQDSPERRPATEQILTTLGVVNEDVQKACGGSFEKMLSIAAVLKNRDAKLQESKIFDTQMAQDRMKDEIKKLKDSNSNLQDNNNRLLAEYDTLRARLAVTEILQEKKEIRLQKNKEIRKRFPLELAWRSQPDMLIGMSKYIQCLELEGILYVGGGYTKDIKKSFKVMAYNMQSRAWMLLPTHSTRMFAMTSINQCLVLAGGCKKDNTCSNEIAVWQSEIKEWKLPFPTMPTPRWGPSATSYKNWLIVAGGSKEKDCCLPVVEILNVFTNQWSSGPPTPIPWEIMKSTVIKGTWYLMGGVGLCEEPTATKLCNVYCSSLESLVSWSEQEGDNVWKQLPSLFGFYSAPINIDGCLYAVGGSDTEFEESKSIICYYNSEDNKWVKAGQLPFPKSDCAGLASSNKLYVIGGWDGKAALKSFLSADI